MRYSDELVEEIRSRNDIVSVIGEHVRLKRAGTQYVGLCPFHSEKTGSFYVSPDKQLYYCFGCHAGGNVITFTMQYLNASFSESLQMLADRAGIQLPKDSYTERAAAADDRRERLLEILRKAAAYYMYMLSTKKGEIGLAYLKKRDLTDETIKGFGLGYAGKYSDELYRYLRKLGYSDELLKDTGLFQYTERGVSDRFWNRVMFPICDVRGRVIGFGGRVMGDGKPKYVNSADCMIFNKRLNLFGLQTARAKGRERILLCEGYMDVISLHQAGFQNAVASLGTALTEEQARLLSRYTREVDLMYDSDGPGIGAAMRAIPILTGAGLAVKVVDLNPYKDPDEFIRGLGAGEMAKRIGGGLNSFLFLSDRWKTEYDLTDPKGKTDFEHRLAREILESFPDEIERNNYTESVCGRHMIDLRAMKRTIAQYAAGGITPRTYETPARERRATQKMPKEESAKQPQRLMLSFLAAYPDAYSASRSYISGKDFTDPFLRKVADILYGQIEAGEISEAALLNHFTELEEQRTAAAVFHDTVAVRDQQELDRAFTDTVLRLMKQSNEVQMNAWNGAADELAALMKKKALIEQLESGGRMLHIRFRE